MIYYLTASWTFSVHLLVYCKMSVFSLNSKYSNFWMEKYSRLSGVSGLIVIFFFGYTVIYILDSNSYKWNIRSSSFWIQNNIVRPFRALKMRIRGNWVHSSSEFLLPHAIIEVRRSKQKKEKKRIQLPKRKERNMQPVCTHCGFDQFNSYPICQT